MYVSFERQVDLVTDIVYDHEFGFEPAELFISSSGRFMVKVIDEDDEPYMTVFSGADHLVVLPLHGLDAIKRIKIQINNLSGRFPLSVYSTITFFDVFDESRRKVG